MVTEVVTTTVSESSVDGRINESSIIPTISETETTSYLTETTVIPTLSETATTFSYKVYEGDVISENIVVDELGNLIVDEVGVFLIHE